ncbi:MAG: hypothetical protein M3Y59_03465, partial [Myxococcota bacterium]|nr:hypothetical protein [Myxococcota bacterium]
NVPSDANTAALFWKGGGEVSKGGKASSKATSKADTAKGGKADPYSDVAQREAFYKSGYSFDDAAAAKASFDFLGSISEAKGYIGLKVINGSEDILAEKGITPAPFDDHEEMAAYFNSDYSYDSAVQAKSMLDFLDSVEDAKAYIGLKVINGSVSILEEVGVFPSSPKGKGSIYPDSGELAEQWTGGEGSKAKGC